MKNSMAYVLAGIFLFLQAGHAAEALPESIHSCKSLRRDSERLACYDRAVAHIESGAVSEAAVSPENMFGVGTTITPPAEPQGEKAREELQQITGKVVSSSHSAGGLMELKLDNDQVWRQQDTDTTLTIETGDSVTISRASLGTFRLTDKRGRSARFRRVR